ncbi:MAG TPA: GntR family transcriptional regulator YhfZ [Symbiobacteriaceae bacterium]
MLHRYGSVAEDLARRLLCLSEGDRLDSVGQLAADFGTGRGTVQSALQVLIQESAVRFETRGKLGSFITHLDYQRLLERAGLSPIIGAMAVAYSLRFQGLAAGITQAFQQAGLPLVLAQIRGGRNRLHFLRTGRCDFAVISRMAWQAEEALGDLRLVLSFGPGSNVGDHVLVFGSPEAAAIADGMRVGVDPSSTDHVRLTQEECEGKAVQLVEISYAQSLARLLKGEIDVTVWDAGVALPFPGLAIRPRQRRLAPDDPDTEAVLVIRAGYEPLGDLLRSRIDPGFVTSVQRRVVAREETPAF